MSLAHIHDDATFTKYQLSIRTTVPINSIASVKTAETNNSRLRRTLGRLCTFHHSKYTGGSGIKLATEPIHLASDTNGIETKTVTDTTTTHHQCEPQTIEFTNGIFNSTCRSNKRNSVDYYV